MKFQILTIILLIVGGFNSQKIEKSFMIRVIPDAGWVLKFEKSGYFEYFEWNTYGGSKTLTKGNYKLKNGLISLQFIEKDTSYQNEIPTKLFYNKMSEKEFEHINERIFASKEEFFFFKKRFIVLSERNL